jgi:hypothetical protein
MWTPEESPAAGDVTSALIDSGPSGTEAPLQSGYIAAAADYQATRTDPTTGVYSGGYIHSAGQYESTGQTQPLGPSVYTNIPSTTPSYVPGTSSAGGTGAGTSGL